MKTTIIHHSADFDGIFCREIARKFMPDANLIGWDFADKPLEDTMLAGHIVVLDLPIDRPFGLEFRDGWICKGKEQIQPIDRWDSGNITWIDHHKSSIDSSPKDIPGYRIDGVAACRLAWQWFTLNSSRLPAKQDYVDRNVIEPVAVRLAGEYDVWDKRDNAADPFQFGLRSRELSETDWGDLLNNSFPEQLQGTGMEATKSDLITSTLVETGRTLQRYQQDVDKGVMGRSFMVSWEGLNFLCLNTPRCNSLSFAAKDTAENGHDALMGFYFNGSDWNLSLYHAKHNTGIDLSAIAVKYGGGGHRGACGFKTTKFPLTTMK